VTTTQLSKNRLADCGTPEQQCVAGLGYRIKRRGHADALFQHGCALRATEARQGPGAGPGRASAWRIRVHAPHATHGLSKQLPIEFVHCLCTAGGDCI
jgi:hypothetical protein